MSGTFSIYRREVKSYFSTPLAYVFLVIFLALAGFLAFRNDFFLVGQASLNLFFEQVPFLLLLFVPAIAMRLWAEERKSNSLELLLTLPVTTAQAVLGKFLAAWTVLALALALTFPMVLTVYWLGSPDRGPIIGGYLASLLLAGTFLAAGSFFSTLTRNQVIAFVLGVIACGALYYAGTPAVLKWLSGALSSGAADLMENFSLQRQFESLQRGVVEWRNLWFFAALIVGWLGGNVLVLDNHR
ncbi:MAG: ABC transporter permease [Planctomycetes bacterium]|nr:ABC transporter permease [Planctomycetota bacterium]